MVICSVFVTVLIPMVIQEIQLINRNCLNHTNFNRYYFGDSVRLTSNREFAVTMLLLVILNHIIGTLEALIQCPTLFILFVAAYSIRFLVLLVQIGVRRFIHNQTNWLEILDIDSNNAPDYYVYIKASVLILQLFLFVASSYLLTYLIRTYLPEEGRSVFE